MKLLDPEQLRADFENVIDALENTLSQLESIDDELNLEAIESKYASIQADIDCRTVRTAITSVRETYINIAVAEQEFLAEKDDWSRGLRLLDLLQGLERDCCWLVAECARLTAKYGQSGAVAGDELFIMETDDAKVPSLA